MALDPNRYRRAELGDPDHKLPMPNGRFFNPAGQIVDLFDGHIIALINDRSIVLREEDAVARGQSAASPEPAADPHADDPHG